MAQQKLSSSDIVSVANTAITGSMTSSQISSVANTAITGLINSNQLAPFTTVTANSFIPNSSSIPTNGVYLPATNTVGIATNSTSRFQVNASGVITKPYQPAFVATGSGGFITATVGSNIPFNTLVSAMVGSNRNGGYNTSTFVYTAPVSGLYYFYAQVYTPSSGAALAWFKNDSQLAFQDIALWTYLNAATGITQISGGTTIVELSAGDYVSTRVRNTTVDVSIYMGHSCFLGYLIG